MKAKIISAVKYLLLLGLGIAMLYFAFKGQDINKIIDDLLNANYYWILLALSCLAVSNYIRALRWKMLIKPLGHNPSAANTYHAVMVGYLANLAFPRMGEVSRCGILVKTDNIPLHSLIGTVIVERVIDLITLIIILVLCITLQFSLIGNFLNNNLFDPLVTKLDIGYLLYIFLGVVFLVMFLLATYLFKRYKNELTRSSIGKKVINLLIGIKEGLTSVLRMEKGWLFIVYSILIWTGYYMATYLCFFSTPATMNLTPMAALIILAIGSIGMTAPVQGGIGAFHWIVSEGLLLFGLSKAEGLSYATINHSSQTLFILVTGAISLVIIVIKSSKKTNIHDNR